MMSGISMTQVATMEVFMTAIKDLLDEKNTSDVFTIGPRDSVFDAVTRMVENNIGAILVIENSVIQGIMTERDYLRFITLQGRSAKDTPVQELMTKKVIYATPGTSLEDVMAIMTEARIRHLPVLFEGRLLGLVSIGDVVKQINKDRKAHITTLEAFISDSYPGPTSMEANN
jgi:CBS domain-containing protein